MLRDALFQRVLSYYLSEGEALRYAREVAEHKRDPYSLIEKIVDELGTPELLYYWNCRTRGAHGVCV